MIKRWDRLSYKQALITVLMVFTLGFIISIYQILEDLKHEKVEMEQQVDQVLNVLKSTASQAAFSLDSHLARQVLDGLFEYKPIYEAEIREDFGGQLAYVERPKTDGSLRFLSDLLFGSFKRYQIALTWDEDRRVVGKLIAHVDTYIVASDFFDRSLLVLISGVIRSLLLAVILATLFYFLLTRSLLNTVKSIAAIRPDDPTERRIPIPPGHEKDELGLLVQAGNRAIDGYRQQISQRMEAEQEMARLQGLLTNVINSMPTVLIGVDVVGQVLQWNREAELVTGVSSSAALGQSLSDAYPELRPILVEIHAAIQGDRQVKEERLIVEREQQHYLDVSVFPLVDSSIEGAVIRIDDVTGRVRIEEVMIQSEKMLSVGGLAAGMAHEINNPLAGILQNVQVIRDRIQEDSRVNCEAAELCGTDMHTIGEYMKHRNIYTMMDLVIDSGNRASKIVDNMLSFSRKSDSYVSLNDLVQLMESSLELAANDYDLKKDFDFRHIDIVREYDQDIPLIPCESTQIQQVLLNIFSNGAQAMTSEGGDDDHRFILRVKKEPRALRVEVEDNGPGMDDAIRRRVFEPFFTTKSVGVGTGLGLSVSYFIIVENHGGEMDLESSPGEGAKFIIRLPLERKKKLSASALT